MANVAVMEHEVENLRKQLDELRTLQTRSRMLTIGFVLVLVVLFGVFLAATSSRIHGNFTREAVEKAVSENTQMLIPHLTREMQLASAEVLPVYRDLALERFKVVGPEIAQETLTKFRNLPKDNLDVLHGRMQASMGRIVENVSPELHQLLAQLPDERETVAIEAFHKRLVDDVSKRGETLATEQMARLQGILTKFDVAVPANKSSEDLERDFVHGLLLMADYELMYSGEEEFFAAPAQPVKAAKTAAAADGAKPAAPAKTPAKTPAKRTTKKSH